MSNDILNKIAYLESIILNLQNELKEVKLR